MVKNTGSLQPEPFVLSWSKCHMSETHRKWRWQKQPSPTLCPSEAIPGAPGSAQDQGAQTECSPADEWQLLELQIDKLLV